MLSPREKQVFKLFLDGLINKEIAVQLKITEKTVKFHNTRIYKKLGVKSKYDLLLNRELDDLYNLL
jgi:DNA-binding CsgD family transcriptional regulator